MKNILYLIFIVLLVSCKKGNSQLKDNILTIPQNILSTEKSIQLAIICKNISTIPLETDSNILIKIIRNIYLYQNILFILHDNQISCFDRKGNFLRKIGNIGNGPGEYSGSPEEATFYDKYIFLNERSAQKLLIYTIEGDYIKTINTNHNISQFKVLNKDLIIGYCPNNQGKEPNKLYVYNWEGVLVDSTKNNFIYNNFNMYIKYDNEHPLFLSKDRLLGFKETFCDTFFIINQDLSFTPFLVSDLGDLTPHPDDVYNQKDLSKMLLRDKLVIEVLFDNPNYMIFSTNKTQFTCIVWDKKNKNIEHIRFLYNTEMSKLFDKEKSYVQIESTQYLTKDGSPYFLPRFVSEDNKYLISYEASATNEDDNPIIVLAEMK